MSVRYTTPPSRVPAQSQRAASWNRKVGCTIMADEEAKKRTQVNDQILKYVTDRPGQIVYRNDIVADLGLEAGTVQRAMLRFVAQELGIECITVGRVWRYSPNKSHNGDRLFSQVKVLKSGAVLIEDEAGALFVARELEG